MTDQPIITDQAVDVFRTAALAEAARTTTDEGIRAGLAAAAPLIAAQERARIANDLLDTVNGCGLPPKPADNAEGPTMTNEPTYNHEGRTLLRRTANGDYIEIGDMRDEHLASYTALALNAAAVA